jgi:hypothetical protein
MMETVRFRLNLSAEKMLAYYQGAAQQVIARASDGRRVQFPAQWLRRFVDCGRSDGPVRDAVRSGSETD